MASVLEQFVDVAALRRQTEAAIEAHRADEARAQDADNAAAAREQGFRDRRDAARIVQETLAALAQCVAAGRSEYDVMVLNQGIATLDALLGPAAIVRDWCIRQGFQVRVTSRLVRSPDDPIRASAQEHHCSCCGYEEPTLYAEFGPVLKISW